MMNFQILPYVELNGEWTMDGAQLLNLWAMMKRERTFERVFCQGGVRDLAEFEDFLRKKDNLVHLVIDRNQGGPVGLFWLTDIKTNHATVHFNVFREYWGEQALAAMKESFRYWFRHKGPDGRPMFDLLCGTIPEDNKLAINFAKKSGATVLEPVIPGIIKNVYTGKWVGAAVMFIKREDANHG